MGGVALGLIAVGGIATGLIASGGVAFSRYPPLISDSLPEA